MFVPIIISPFVTKTWAVGSVSLFLCLNLYAFPFNIMKRSCWWKEEKAKDNTQAQYIFFTTFPLSPSICHSQSLNLCHISASFVMRRFEIFMGFTFHHFFSLPLPFILTRKVSNMLILVACNVPLKIQPISPFQACQACAVFPCQGKSWKEVKKRWKVVSKKTRGYY